jgi:hypothetical protein
MSIPSLWPRGEYQDRLSTAMGSDTLTTWHSNRIVTGCRLLLAAFMRGDEPLGIQQLKVGRGLAAWDGEPPGPPPPSTQELADPEPFVVAVDPSAITYLDATGASTTGPTNRLQIEVTLAAEEPPPDDESGFPLREFGLFGTLGGEEYMINYVRHPVINKQAGDTLTRTIRLVF